MRFREFLAEKAERVTVWSGATISVFHNPSKEVFDNLVSRTTGIRGLLSQDGRDIWVWDGGMAIHSNIIQELGLGRHDCVMYDCGRKQWFGPVGDIMSSEYYPAVQKLTPKPQRPRSAKEDEELDRILDELNAWDDLKEAAKPTSAFLKKVRQHVRHIGSGDWEYPDDAELMKLIDHKRSEIDFHARTGNSYMVERIELRPEDHYPDGLASIGCHWSWQSNGAKAYHHDNARDAHGDDVEEMMVIGEVHENDIDWAFTYATNLILPSEAEITIKPGAQMKLTSVWIDDMERPLGMTAIVTGDYA